MMFKNRCWCVGQAESPEQLARDLNTRSWTLCTGFQYGAYLFLNDATSEDGVQEYAVLLITDTGFVQIESITFSWCRPDQAFRLVMEALTGKWDRNDFAQVVRPRLESPEDHRRCHLCA